MSNEIREKMSEFSSKDIDKMKTDGAKVPVFVSGVKNYSVPLDQFASTDDVLDVKGTIRNGGDLTDGDTVRVPNNALSKLQTSLYAHDIELNVDLGTYNSEGFSDDQVAVPNFAVEIDARCNSTITVTRTHSVYTQTGEHTVTEEEITTALRYSADAGNQIEAGKFYQITCVGSCWTLAEFVQPVVSEPEGEGE